MIEIQTVVYLCDGISHNDEKERTAEIHNKDETQKNLY